MINLPSCFRNRTCVLLTWQVQVSISYYVQDIMGLRMRWIGLCQNICIRVYMIKCAKWYILRNIWSMFFLFLFVFNLQNILDSFVSLPQSLKNLCQVFCVECKKTDIQYWWFSTVNSIFPQWMLMVCHQWPDFASQNSLAVAFWLDKH